MSPAAQTPADQSDPAARTAIRLRKLLDGDLAARDFPAGFTLRTFETSDALALHTLLALCFDDGSDGPFDEWWPSRSADPEFDPSLVFLVHAADGQLAGAAFCWTRNFVRDFAVHPDHRRKGIGEALLLAVFAEFPHAARRRSISRPNRPTARPRCGSIAGSACSRCPLTDEPAGAEL